MSLIRPTPEHVAREKGAGWHLFFVEVSEWPIGPPTEENREIMDWMRIQFRNTSDPHSPCNPIKLHSVEVGLPPEMPGVAQPSLEVISNSDPEASFVQVRVRGFQDPARPEPFPPTCEVAFYCFVQEPLDEASVFYYASDRATYDSGRADGGTVLPNLAVRIQRGTNSDDYELSTGLETTRMNPPSGGCGDYPEPDVSDTRNSESVPPES